MGRDPTPSVVMEKSTSFFENDAPLTENLRRLCAACCYVVRGIMKKKKLSV